MLLQRSSLFRHFLGGVLALLIGGAALARESIIVQMTGTAQIDKNDGRGFVPLTQAMTVPVGATIKTDAGAEIFLEVLTGAVATIKGNTTVKVDSNRTRQEGAPMDEVQLDLKGGGSVISTINPRLKGQIDYKVSTPLGVAAARGTVFSVRVVSNSTTIGTLSGTIQIQTSSGLISLPFGNAVTSAGQAQLAAAIAADPGLATDIADAVKVVADNVKAATTAVDSPDQVASTLAAVVSAASAALPNQAASFVETAVAAAVSSTSSTGNSSAGAAATNNAVSAITEAAVKAAPGQTESIVREAAATVVEVKVTEAVTQARATGGNATAAATQATANAQSTLQSVAQGAVNASGSTSTAGNIASAVNAGASTGAQAASRTTNTTVATPPPVAPPTNTTGSSVTAPPTTQLIQVDPDQRNVSTSN